MKNTWTDINTKSTCIQRVYWKNLLIEFLLGNYTELKDTF